MNSYHDIRKRQAHSHYGPFIIHKNCFQHWTMSEYTHDAITKLIVVAVSIQFYPLKCVTI